MNVCILHSINMLHLFCQTLPILLRIKMIVIWNLYTIYILLKRTSIGSEPNPLEKTLIRIRLNKNPELDPASVQPYTFTSKSHPYFNIYHP